MHKQNTAGLWWQPDGWLRGYCRHDARVQAIDKDATADTTSRFIPAPVDLHIHGGGGFDCMNGEAAIRGVLKSAATTGTGALLATSVTASFEKLSEFLQHVKAVMEHPDKDAAVLLGAHLEGPFINPDKLGAQPDEAAPIDLDQLEAWFATGVVRVVTFAPELAASNALLDLCERYAVKAQIGHTLCSWQQAQAALLRGCGTTHLFNAMSGVQARSAGAAAAALAYAEYAEVITDGLHVEEAAFTAARRAIPKLYSVTDATAATGMPDGGYTLGSYNTFKQGNAVRLSDGTLAGSCLTQLRSIEQLRSWGLDWHEVACFCSTRPASWINARQVGDIAAGSLANWLEIRDDTPVALWLQGQRIKW